MKKFVLISLFFTLMTVGVFAQFDPAWLNEVTIKNSTGEEWLYLFFSPSDTEFWGPDILGEEGILEEGQSQTYEVFYPELTVYMDCQAVGKNGNIYEYMHFFVSDEEAGYLEFTSDHLASQVDMTEFTRNLKSFTIENLTDQALYYLFISPNDSDAFGVDYLGSQGVVENREEIVVYLPDPGYDVRYDVMGVDGYNDTYSFSYGLTAGESDEYVDVVPEDIDL